MTPKIQVSQAQSHCTVCAGGGVGHPGPHCPAPSPVQACRRPPCPGTQRVSKAQKVWEHFLSHIFSKAQYLFWGNTTSRYYLFFKNSKTLTQPQGMFPPHVLEPGCPASTASQHPSPLPRLRHRPEAGPPQRPGETPCALQHVPGRGAPKSFPISLTVNSQASSKSPGPRPCPCRPGSVCRLAPMES